MYIILHVWTTLSLALLSNLCQVMGHRGGGGGENNCHKICYLRHRESFYNLPDIFVLL